MNDNLAYYIKKFLTIYLKDYKNASYNCICSYRDTFKLLIKFYIDELKINSINLDFENFTLNNINLFIQWIKENRNCSISTCNQRLACLKSFSNFLLHEKPELLLELQKIIKKSQLKNQKCEIQFLNLEQVKSILNKPNKKTKKGLKELTLLSTLYDTGMRVSELINLKIEDVSLDEIATIKVFGKGSKYRTIPISTNLKNLLSNYINIFNIKSGVLFKSNQCEQYTSNGIRYIISKYTDDIDFKVTPHTFRHSKASHLLEANVPLIYIRDLLGHNYISTTEIYAKVNINLKNKVLNQNSDLDEQKTNSWNSNCELLDWLNNL